MTRPTIAVLVLVCAAVFAPEAAQPPAPLKSGQKILWIGNSYSDWFGPTPDCLKALLASASPAVTIQTKFIVKGMGILKEYYTWQNLGARAAISQGGWTYVVIQGWEDAIDRSDTDVKSWPACQDTFVKYAGLFFADVKAAGSTMILFDGHPCTWNYVSDLQRMKSTYDKVRKQLPDLFVFSTAAVWDSVSKVYPSPSYKCPGGLPQESFIQILYHDCGHQNGNGRALDAYAFYSLLSGGKSGRSLSPAWPGGIRDKRFDPDKLPQFADIAQAVTAKQTGSATAALPTMAASPHHTGARAGAAMTCTLLGERIRASSSRHAPGQVRLTAGHGPVLVRIHT